MQKRVAKKCASEFGSKSGVMRAFQKGITLGGRSLRRDHKVCLQKGLQKNVQIFASEFGSKSGVMRGFQKGITLGGRSPRSDHKV